MEAKSKEELCPTPGPQTLFLQSYLFQIILTSGPQTPRILGLSQPAGNERPPTAKKTPAEVKSFIGMEEMKSAQENVKD